jgi:hypothetical protein
VIGLLAAIWLALLFEKFWLPHYFAPGAGAALVLLFVACCFGHGLAAVVFACRDFVVAPQEQAIEKINALSKPGERYLVIVRYRPRHDVHVEYVFNRADIDHSRELAVIT